MLVLKGLLEGNTHLYTAEISMAKKKNLPKRISEEFSRRVSSEATSRRDFLKSSVRSRLESLVPYSLRWLLPFVEELKSGQEEEEEETAVHTPIEVTQPRKVTQVEPTYKQYPCIWGDPLTCERLQQAVQQNPETKDCQECGFPASLPEKAEIRGDRGRYRVDSLLGRRGMGRLYRGTQLSNSHQVVIKEYLLPENYFNQEEAKARKDQFRLIAGVNLADGRVEDFRLCQPWEAIADHNQERCYLITKGNIDFYPTLTDYLAMYGPMNAIAVRQVLNQVLQTLEFLHTQKFRLPSGQVQQGLTHGNLNLSSLLIASTQEQGINRQNGANRNGSNNIDSSASWRLNSNFFIYVYDLALWENLFDPSTFDRPKPTPSQDLVALGYVAFYLLAGGKVNRDSGQIKDPKDDQQWPPVNFALKAFILRLMGLEMSFESAEVARRALLKLPPELLKTEAFVQVIPEEQEKTKTPRFLFLLLGILGLLLLGLLFWFLLRKPQESDSAGDELPLCCINDVTGIPAGKFTYTGEREGIWSYVLQQKNLVLADRTLEEELTKRQPKLQLNFKPESSVEEVIKKVRAEPRKVRSEQIKVRFAVTNFVDNFSSDLEYKKVAYDSLVVFVNFSYSKRKASLPQALKGQITLEQLRQIYTGKIANWKELGGPNLPIKLYIPDETDAVRIFEQRVLKDEPTIELFKSLQKPGNQDNSFTNSWVAEIERVPTIEMLRRVIQNFEDNQVGAIAFGTLSKVFGQCSVYPLALVEGEKEPVQVLVQDNGQPINPTTDLCKQKGSYFPNQEVLQTERYPLGYPLAVVYPKDNSRPPFGAKFAEILQTQEGQKLLSKTGVVPLQRLTRP